MGKLRYQREIDHFTKLGHIWWGARTVAGQRRYDNKLQLLQQLCKPLKNQTILEIGCGDGEFTKRLAKLDSKIVATDLTPSVIRKAKGLFVREGIRYSRIQIIIGNAENLPFADSTFDIVCGVSILHHINTKRALKEAFRVLKKRGKIFFSEPNLLNPHTFAGLHIPWLREQMEYSPDETAFVRWQVDSLLRETGFRQVVVMNYDFLHPKTPPSLIESVEKLSHILEKIPLVKEISGSLIIWAVK